MRWVDHDALLDMQLVYGSHDRSATFSTTQLEPFQRCALSQRWFPVPKPSSNVITSPLPSASGSCETGYTHVPVVATSYIVCQFDGPTRFDSFRLYDVCPDAGVIVVRYTSPFDAY